MAGDAAWIRSFLSEIGHMIDGPIILQEDNTGAKKWSEDSSLNKNKRHIRIAFHYVRQEVEAGHIKVEYVESAQNPADGLTKALDKTAFKHFVELLALGNGSF